MQVKSIVMKTPPLIFVIIFLCSFFSVAAIAADDTPQIDPALELINVLGCKGCHVISGKGGSLATDLTHIGSRLSAKQIEAQLTSGSAAQVKGFMPSYTSLPKADLQRISEYLYNLH